MNVRHITTNLHLAIYDISIASAHAKSGEMIIAEISNLHERIGMKLAEKARAELEKTGVRVRQLSNMRHVDAFTDRKKFINQQMRFRFIPREIFPIDKEILVFDDTVAYYDDNNMLVVEDGKLAGMARKQLEEVWQRGMAPELGFEYSPQASILPPRTLVIGELPCIVYQDVDAPAAYGEMSDEQIISYIEPQIMDNETIRAAEYALVYLWSNDGVKMNDIWYYTANSVDGHSGPLADMKLYENGVQTTGEIASGATLLVLGREEEQRRRATNVEAYLWGERPTFPYGMVV